MEGFNKKGKWDLCWLNPKLGWRFSPKCFFPLFEKSKGISSFRIRCYSLVLKWMHDMSVFSSYEHSKRSVIQNITWKGEILEDWVRGWKKRKEEIKDQRLDESKQKFRRKPRQETESTALGSSALVLLFSYIKVNKLVTVLFWTFSFSLPDTASKFSTWALMFLHSSSERWGGG